MSAEWPSSNDRMKTAPEGVVESKLAGGREAKRKSWLTRVLPVRSVFTLQAAADGSIAYTWADHEHGRHEHAQFFGREIRLLLERWVVEGRTHRFASGVGRYATALSRIEDALRIQLGIVTWEK